MGGFSTPGTTAHQVAFAEITSDTTTTSTTYTDLLTVTMSTGAKKILILFSAGFTSSVGGKFVFFRLTIDGVDKKGFASPIAGANDYEASALNHVETVAAGSHTIKIQWKVTTGGTAVINASTDANSAHHAKLTAIEIIQ